MEDKNLDLISSLQQKKVANQKTDVKNNKIIKFLNNIGKRGR